MSGKVIRLLLKFQFITSLFRSSETVLLTILLPCVLFVIFGLAFSVDSVYAAFFLPGMIGSIITSDALYSVAPEIKKYYTLQIVRYFRGYPLNIIWIFVTLILTRLVYISFASVLVILLSVFIFDYTPDFNSLILYLIGIFLGFSIYSLIGLTISLYGIKDDKDQSIFTLVYLMSIFLADAFFKMSRANDFFSVVSYFFPLRPVLDFMRGDLISVVYCFIWLLASLIFYYFKVNSMELKRL